MNTAGCVGDRRVFQAIASSRNRLIDFVACSDSNTIFGGHGYDHGYQYALDAAGVPMYGTGILSCREADGNGAGTGYKYARVSTSSDGATSSGAPAALDDYLDKGGGSLTPHNYFYLATGNFFGNTNSGMEVDLDCPLDVEANLRYDLDHGTFDSGTPTIQLFSRIDESPWTEVGGSVSQSTNTGTLGVVTTSHTVSAAARTTGLQFRWAKPGSSITAPVFCLWQTVINTDRNAGFRFNVLDYRGGVSARSVADDLQRLSDTAIQYYFERVRARQVELGYTPRVVVFINEGLNDRNETLTSLGPAGVTDGDSAEAFVDNMQAIINRISGVWSAKGWDIGELYFFLVSPHAVSDPNDVELLSYQSALVSLCGRNQRTAAVFTPEILSYDDFVNGGYFNSGGSDTSHLTQAGYEAACSAIINQVLVAANSGEDGTAAELVERLERSSGKINQLAYQVNNPSKTNG